MKRELVSKIFVAIILVVTVGASVLSYPAPATRPTLQALNFTQMDFLWAKGQYLQRHDFRSPQEDLRPDSRVPDVLKDLDVDLATFRVSERTAPGSRNGKDIPYKILAGSLRNVSPFLYQVGIKVRFRDAGANTVGEDWIYSGLGGKRVWELMETAPQNATQVEVLEIRGKGQKLVPYQSPAQSLMILLVGVTAIVLHIGLAGVLYPGEWERRLLNAARTEPIDFPPT